MLDIDDTIVRHKASKSLNEFLYTGSRADWYVNMLDLQQKAKLQGIEIHYGIATGKNLYLSPRHKAANWQGDFLSAHLLGKNFDQDPPKSEEELQQLGLGELINPHLVYYLGEHIDPILQKIKTYDDMYDAETNPQAQEKLITENSHAYSALCKQFDQAKAIHALQVAQEYIQTTYKTTIPNSDIFLIDNLEGNCKYTAKLGFNAVCVTNDLVTKCPPTRQGRVIQTVFKILAKYIFEESLLPVEEPVKTALANWRNWQSIIQDSINQPKTYMEKSFFSSKTPETTQSSSSVSSPGVHV